MKNNKFGRKQHSGYIENVSIKSSVRPVPSSYKLKGRMPLTKHK